MSDIRKNFRDIDDIVAEHERDPHRKELLDKAREDLRHSLSELPDRASGDRGTLLLNAARDPDWQQVAMNGGPPCFHIDADGRFCFRARRWHDTGTHHFTTLHDALRAAVPAVVHDASSEPRQTNAVAVREALAELVRLEDAQLDGTYRADGSLTAAWKRARALLEEPK